MSPFTPKNTMMRSGEDVDVPGFGGEALGDLSGVDAVVHQEKFHVFFVSDEELLEARLELISGLLVLLATDLRLSDLASEASSHAGVNTSLLSPRSLLCKKKRAVSKHQLNCARRVCRHRV